MQEIKVNNIIIGKQYKSSENIFKSVNEIYGIIYDGDVSFLNEKDSDEFDYNRYSRFIRTHEASVYQMLGIDYCIKNNIPIL